jgi:hypothetical protein
LISEFILDSNIGGGSKMPPSPARRLLLWQLLFRAYFNFCYFEDLGSYYIWADRIVRILSGLSACAALTAFFPNQFPAAWKCFVLLSATASVTSVALAFASDAGTLGEIKLGWLECANARQLKWALTEDGAELTEQDLKDLQTAETKLEHSARRFPRMKWLVIKAQDEACELLGVPKLSELSQGAASAQIKPAT